MRSNDFFFGLFILLSFTSLPGITQSPRAEINDLSVIHLADPTILHHQGIYYLYGTVEGSANNGFLVYTSNNLKTWKRSSVNEGYALKKGDAFGTAGFWAPQVFLHKNMFYMAYTANEQIGVAVSNSPLGPFIQTLKLPLDAPVKQIDPFIFIDDDGKKYLFHVRLTNGNRIFVAEMNDDFSAIKPETLRECIDAKDSWENTANVPWPVAEGPSLLKRGNVYYLFYSANDFRNPDYAVGFATSNSPIGPWKKHPGNPVLYKKLVGQNGPGHGDFFKHRKKLLYVFHTHNSEKKVGPRKTALMQGSFDEKKMSVDAFLFDQKSFQFLKK